MIGSLICLVVLLSHYHGDFPLDTAWLMVFWIGSVESILLITGVILSAIVLLLEYFGVINPIDFE